MYPLCKICRSCVGLGYAYLANLVLDVHVTFLALYEQNLDVCFWILHTRYGALVAVKIQSFLNPPSSRAPFHSQQSWPSDPQIFFCKSSPREDPHFWCFLVCSVAPELISIRNSELCSLFFTQSVITSFCNRGGRRGPKFSEELLLNVLEVKRKEWLLGLHTPIMWTGGVCVPCLVAQGAHVEN